MNSNSYKSKLRSSNKIRRPQQTNADFFTPKQEISKKNKKNAKNGPTLTSKFSKIRCSYCKELIDEEDMQDHQDLCYNNKKKCPYCGELFASRLINSHINVCNTSPNSFPNIERNTPFKANEPKGESPSFMRKNHATNPQNEQFNNFTPFNSNHFHSNHPNNERNQNSMPNIQRNSNSNSNNNSNYHNFFPPLNSFNASNNQNQTNTNRRTNRNPFNPFQLFGESNSSNQHQFSFPSFFETNQTRNSRNTFMNNETSANTNTNNRSDFAHNENNRANNNPFQHNEPERDRNPFLERNSSNNNNNSNGIFGSNSPRRGAAAANNIFSNLIQTNFFDTFDRIIAPGFFNTIRDEMTNFEAGEPVFHRSFTFTRVPLDREDNESNSPFFDFSFFMDNPIFVTNSRDARENRARGLNEEEIRNIPISTFNTTRPNPLEKKETNKSCVVCLEDFKNGDQLKTLVCGHKFHKNCIDHWLPLKGSCPICRINLSRPQN